MSPVKFNWLPWDDSLRWFFRKQVLHPESSPDFVAAFRCRNSSVKTSLKKDKSFKGCKFLACFSNEKWHNYCLNTIHAPQQKKQKTDEPRHFYRFCSPPAIARMQRKRRKWNLGAVQGTISVWGWNQRQTKNADWLEMIKKHITQTLCFVHQICFWLPWRVLIDTR